MDSELVFAEVQQIIGKTGKFNMSLGLKMEKSEVAGAANEAGDGGAAWKK